ncbi:acetylxylan esterase [Lactobacillus crispatus]|uniref:Acetylxylan esterase n=1 Tax=Lactobacillus crispatus TaxID=47770 RepID=A0A2N5L0T1_9LACO|nr:acetylxylan esterase [Lactobacillus crispatus]PLT12086.1 acetylxylan esterase [Lactobacillus crispatus]
MPLQEMKTYKGRQEVPDDFDEFWDKQIQKVNENLPYKIVKRNFGLKNVWCFDLFFEGTNNGIVHAKCVFPAYCKKAPVVFRFHGYMGQALDWADLLQYEPMGVGLVAMDVRGQQGQSVDGEAFYGNTVLGHIVRGAVDGPEHLFYKDVFLDAYSLIEIVSDFEMVDEDKLYTWGDSQGGALALVSAALNPRIKKCATQYPFLSDFKRILELGPTTLPYEELFRYFKFYDPFHKTEAKLLNTLSYIDVKNFAHRIKCPVLMFTGLEDKTCFPSTQFAIYNRILSKKDHILLPEYDHEPMFYYVSSAVSNWLLGTKFPLEPPDTSSKTFKDEFRR